MTPKKRTPVVRNKAPKPAPPATVTSIVDAQANALIDDYVNDATRHYAEGRPGRGEFILARLGEKLTRLERTAKDLQDALARS